MKLRRPFTIATGTTTEALNLVARLEIDDQVGLGEAAPSPRVTGEAPEACHDRLATWGRDADALRHLLESLDFAPGSSTTPAAQNAVATAWLDAAGKSRRASARSLLNLPPGRIDSSVTLSIGPPEAVVREAAERDAEGWKIFKVKLGGPCDDAALHALRDRYPDKRIRVDANEGWTPSLAAERLALLERLDVEFVEQPLARHQLAETKRLADRFEIPIILDEPLLDAQSAVDLVARGVADGGNIKLNKCGGAFEARRTIKILRDGGWKVMMGCMLESSLGVAAAAAFAGTLDYADLDAHALLADDPFRGFASPGGTITTPEGPGVGVEPASPTRLDSL